MSELLLAFIVGLSLPAEHTRETEIATANAVAASDCESCMEVSINGTQVYAECYDDSSVNQTCWSISGPDITPDCGAGGPCVAYEMDLELLSSLELDGGQELLYTPFGQAVSVLLECREYMPSDAVVRATE